MAIERRKKEWVESVDPMKMYIPKEFGAEQDPPKMEKADIVILSMVSSHLLQFVTFTFGS